MGRLLRTIAFSLCLLVFVPSLTVFLIGVLTRYQYRIGKNYGVILTGGVYLFDNRTRGGPPILDIWPGVMMAVVGTSGLLVAVFLIYYFRRHRARWHEMRPGFPVKISK